MDVSSATDSADIRAIKKTSREVVSEPTYDFEYSFCSLVSDPSLYMRMLSSFEAAGFDNKSCEFLFINNSSSNQGDGYTGLNRMIAHARGKYVVLCHQDLLAIDSKAVLDKRLAALETIAPDWGVAGNAGSDANGVLQIRITDKFTCNNHPETTPVKVSSLDENFIILRSEALLGFSCDLQGFHLYGTDIVTQAMLRGRSTWVIDYHLEHLGNATVNQSFEQCLTAIHNKYRKSFRSRTLDTTSARVAIGRQSLSAWLWHARLRRKLGNEKLYKFGSKAAVSLKSFIEKVLVIGKGNKYLLDGVSYSVGKHAPFQVRKALRRGQYEHSERDLVKKWLPKDMPVIELGGSYGIVSTIIRGHINPDQTLTIVEANPDLIQFGKINVAQKSTGDNVVFINAAVTHSSEKEVSFDVTASVLNSSIATKSDNTIQVPTISLDSILEGQSEECTYSLVCDIEGAEYGLFENSQQALSRCHIAIIEVHPDFFYGIGKSVSDFYQVLSTLGFEIVDEAANVIVAKKPDQ
jgi:FkbM family methyltransferase